MKDIEVTRCSWCGTDPLYVKYHDDEWGVPTYDDKIIFEFLVLESAQAGLSWIAILRKREGYRKAFADFEVKKVATFTESRIQKLMLDASIVRNELKIRAAVNNAREFIKIQKEFGSFAKYMWAFVDGKPIRNKWNGRAGIPVTTKESDAFAKDLKKRGFKFLGSTTIYAHMQALGMVNDHAVDCFRYKQVGMSV